MQQIQQITSSENENSLRVHRVSVCEFLDRVLNKGAVLTGEIVISVADIALLYVGVNLLISSVETLLEAMAHPTGEEQTDEIC